MVAAAAAAVLGYSNPRKKAVRERERTREKQLRHELLKFGIFASHSQNTQQENYVGMNMSDDVKSYKARQFINLLLQPIVFVFLRICVLAKLNCIVCEVHVIH